MAGNPLRVAISYFDDNFDQIWTSIDAETKSEIEGLPHVGGVVSYGSFAWVDDNRVAISLGNPWNPPMWVVDVVSKELDSGWPPHLVAEDDGGSGVAVNPSRTLLAILTNSQRPEIVDIETKQSLDGVPSLHVEHSASVYPRAHCQWLDDNRLVIYSNNAEKFFALNVSTMTWELDWTSAPGGTRARIHEVSPDGRRFGFISTDSEMENRQSYFIIRTDTKNVESGWPTTIMDDDGDRLRALAWSPDSSKVALSQRWDDTTSYFRVVDVESKGFDGGWPEKEEVWGLGWSRKANILLLHHNPIGGRRYTYLDGSTKGEIAGFPDFSGQVSSGVPPRWNDRVGRTTIPDLRVAGRDTNVRVPSFSKSLQQSSRVGPGGHW